MVRSKGLAVLFLMETKRSITEMLKLCYDLNFQSVLAILSDGQSGGLGLLWKAECDLHIQTFSPHHIDAHIMVKDEPPWRLTGFYRRPEGHRKHESWRLLRHLHARASLPWVCLGDYNEILNSGEKQGGIPKALTPMLAFKETLLHCGLEDLGYHGYPFTWHNGRSGEAFVELRLDRACVC
ncbi:uncharacterized protein LOC142628878 [Castanea sativa]|uniref:uncharacterized protein LOC142628878 n=1 Tax=Castanea sativa TaxID=21020 RepID=UPI003F64F9E3